MLNQVPSTRNRLYGPNNYRNFTSNVIIIRNNIFLASQYLTTHSFSTTVTHLFITYFLQPQIHHNKQKAARYQLSNDERSDQNNLFRTVQTLRRSNQINSLKCMLHSNTNLGPFSGATTTRNPKCTSKGSIE